MAISSVYVPPPPEDWRARLKEMRGQAYSTADQGMVAQPYADPGNAMPFVQAPSQPQQNQQEVLGWLPAGGQNALTHPLLLELLRQRPDLAKHFMQQNQLMMPQC